MTRRSAHVLPVRRLHVLYVEPDENLRDAVTDVLLGDGYVVTPVANRGAALGVLAAAGPDQLPEVCVIDPHDDGAVLEELHSKPDRYARVAVVTLSFGMDPQPQADVEVRRPYTVLDLERSITAALTKKGHQPEPNGPHAT
jgi:CheY-like chemotaxis protein